MSTGIVSGNQQNAPGGGTLHSRSKFPLSYSVFQTERFAEIVPFHVIEGVSGDKLPLHSNHEVQTYTLKSPILQSLSKKKDFFAVPMQAILPLNWDKFYINPNIGQDVPTDSGLGVVSFWNSMRTLFNNSFAYLSTYYGDAGFTDATYLEYWLKFLIFFERIYSNGSLMETLGISGASWFKCIWTDSNSPSSDQYSITFDDIFDKVCSILNTSLVTNPGSDIVFTLGGVTYEIVVTPKDYARSANQQLTLRQALEMMRDDMSFTIVSGVQLNSITTDLNAYWNELSPAVYGGTSPLNLGRLWAYQLVVAHFFSNDHIDFIYSAELFRQYIRQISTRATIGGNVPLDYVPNFVVNGLSYEYDALSASTFTRVITGFGTNGIFSYQTGITIPDSLHDAFAYFTALFSFKRSLRFLDYFTGARAYPLAVGDHEAVVGTITPGKLDVIELSKASMRTKFLQAVNRSGRKFSAYMQELFGKTPAYDYHNPMFLAHQSDLVGAPETDNTGQAQVTDQIAVTSRFRATASRYAYEFTPDRDCIVIGLTYYDIPRVYTLATERQNFVLDRFDMFNPYLQYTGDQYISEAELGTDTPDYDRPFAYTNKDMQYKQRFNQANGAFAVPSTGLDHWIFVADTLRRRYFHNISPSFIRSFNSELDRFYQRLTGYSLGTYFHFIVRYDNRMDASRPMAYNPTVEV